jgi:hypothetical protein
VFISPDYKERWQKMKRIDTLLKFVLLVAILLCMLTVLDYLALHDIHKDYVSQFVLNSLNVELSKPLPAWTNTELEWNIITINYLLKILMAVINIVLVVVVMKTVRKDGRKNPEQE